MKKLLLFAIIALGLFAGTSLWQSQKSTKAPEPTPSTPEETKEVHLHAGFVVYKDSELQDFSALEYMHIKPCTDDEHEEAKGLSAEEEQIEKAHLHDFVPDVVHVHREGSTWQDLFLNLKYPLDPEAQAYVNGQLVDNIFNYPIKAYDSVVFFEGENRGLETKLETAVTREHIKETEAEGESC